MTTTKETTMPRKADPNRETSKNRVLTLSTQRQVDIYEAGREKAAATHADMRDYVIDLIAGDLGWDQFHEHTLIVDATSHVFGDDRDVTGSEKRFVEVRARLLMSSSFTDEIQWRIFLSEKGNVLVHEESVDRGTTELWVFATFDEAREVMAREGGPVGVSELVAAEQGVPREQRSNITRLDI